MIYNLTWQKILLFISVILTTSSRLSAGVQRQAGADGKQDEELHVAGESERDTSPHTSLYMRKEAFPFVHMGVSQCAFHSTISSHKKRILKCDKENKYGYLPIQ